MTIWTKELGHIYSDLVVLPCLGIPGHQINSCFRGVIIERIQASFEIEGNNYLSWRWSRQFLPKFEAERRSLRNAETGFSGLGFHLICKNSRLRLTIQNHFRVGFGLMVGLRALCFSYIKICSYSFR